MFYGIGRHFLLKQKKQSASEVQYLKYTKGTDY